MFCIGILLSINPEVYITNPYYILYSTIIFFEHLCSKNIPHLFSFKKTFRKNKGGNKLSIEMLQIKNFPIMPNLYTL